jgi:hypothetical protein
LNIRISDSGKGAELKTNESKDAFFGEVGIESIRDSKIIGDRTNGITIHSCLMCKLIIEADQIYEDVGKAYSRVSVLPGGVRV